MCAIHTGLFNIVSSLTTVYVLEFFCKMGVIFPPYRYVTTREVACMPAQIVLYKNAVKRQQSYASYLNFYLYLKLLSPFFIKTIEVGNSILFLKIGEYKMFKNFSFLYVCGHIKYGGVQQSKLIFCR